MAKKTLTVNIYYGDEKYIPGQPVPEWFHDKAVKFISELVKRVDLSKLESESPSDHTSHPV